MPQHIIIIGAGFAGLYAALSAARLRDLEGVSSDELDIALIAPKPELAIRPRLYELRPETLTAPLSELFAVTEVRYVQGGVTDIDTADKRVTYTTEAGGHRTMPYDRLILATGSHAFEPPIPGLAEHAFSVTQLEDAVRLDRHLASLATRPRSAARNTVVVAGSGLTGLETATEMPDRLRAILGEDAAPRVVLVERGADVGPDIGPGPRPVIEDALRVTGVELRTGAGVTALDAGGVTLSNGQRIESETVIWTGGMRASALTGQIAAERDMLGRLYVDDALRVPNVPGVFAAGDTANAATDDVGNRTAISCQHALRLGAFAGNNAAAELLGLPTSPYRQPAYVTCLDLGPAGAVFTRGWDRQVELVGEPAKALKREINTQWIYPPPADRALALAAAEPARVVDL